MWAPVESAYARVLRAAAILTNAAGLEGAAVKESYRGLLGAMARRALDAGELAGGLGQFRKVTRSYWPGLFHWYDVPDLPRTDNDLEQLFASLALRAVESSNLSSLRLQPVLDLPGASLAVIRS